MKNKPLLKNVDILLSDALTCGSAYCVLPDERSIQYVVGRLFDIFKDGHYCHISKIYTISNKIIEFSTEETEFTDRTVFHLGSL